MPLIDTNGLQLEYDETGPPDGPAMILIMGLGTQMIAWPDTLRFGLAERGYRVIRFDNRDTGLSTKLDGVPAPGMVGMLLWSLIGRRPKAPYTLDDMADDTLGLLDALDIDAAHFFGVSMGGMIAQVLAAQHPERVRSLTVAMSSSGRRGLPGPTATLRRHLLFERPTGGDREARIEHGFRTWKLLGSPDYPPDEDILRARVTRFVDRAYYPQGFFRQMAAILSTGSLVRRIRSIDVPTLVLHGTADPLVPDACGRDVAAEIRSSRLELIEGMGHTLPEVLLPRIVRLVADHASAAG